MTRARPTILEPVMNVEVYAPSDFAGDLMGDLNGRRGRIAGMDTRGATTIIKAQVPMSEMLTYEQHLTSATGGRGSLSHGVLALRRGARAPAVEDHRRREGRARGCRSRGGVIVVYGFSFTGCTSAPLPAESHAAKRTHFFPAASNGMTQRCRPIGAADRWRHDLAAGRSAVAPDHLDEVERKRNPFDLRFNRASSTDPLTRCDGDQNFAGRHEIVAAHQRLDDRADVLGRRQPIELARS